MMKRFIFSIVGLIASFSAYSQTGIITGKIIDGDTGMEMVGANVIISGTYIGASSDLDGNYALKNVEPGTYSLICKFISYADIVIENVEVIEGEVTHRDFTMGQDVLLIGEAIIETKEERGNVIAIDRMKAKSAGMLDGMSSQTIKKTGDNNVASAAKRVTGVSIEGGKYVYVRGLSDRYSKTLLNNAEIPGLDPNRNSVQLDLFPTALVENMTISKTFTPNQPASYAGGLINIETKDFPEEKEHQVSLSLGYNSNATFNDNFLTYQGGKYDFIGFDDGTRQLPKDVKGNTVPQAPVSSTDNSAQARELTKMTQSFNKTWDNSYKSPMMNTSFAFSMGDQKGLKKEGMAIGYNMALTYRNFYDFYENGITGRYNLLSSSSNKLNTESVLKDSRGDHNVIWGMLFNTSLKINSRSNLGIVLLRNQNGISSSRFQQGQDNNLDPDLTYQATTLRYLERSLTTAQIKGEQISKSEKLKTNWIVSYAYATQETPDLRTFERHFERKNDGSIKWGIDGAAYNEPNRFYRDMNEYNLDTKLDFEMPFKMGNDALSSVLKFGASNVSKKRNYSETRYDFKSRGVQFNGEVNTYFADNNMDATTEDYLYLRDLSDDRNNYDATENVAAAYAMIDYKINHVWRLAAGVRVENASIETISKEYYNTTDEIEKSKLEGRLDNVDVLPSLNVIYAVNEKSNIRASATRTLARPTFRELAPFAMYDFDYQFVKIGNPNLQRTLIDNYDLRYEIFPKAGDLISASAYYKNFQGPIELVTNPEAPNLELTWKNQEYGRVYGVEFEFRKSLEFISKKLSNYSFGFNGSYILSETKIDIKELDNIRATDPNHKETRQMFGQSPYLLNTYLGWTNDSLDWKVYLSYNVSGPKMVLVTDGGTPDVFEQPKHMFDINVMKRFGERLSIAIVARNVLDAESRWTYTYKNQDYYFQKYSSGRRLSVKVAYTF